MSGSTRRRAVSRAENRYAVSDSFDDPRKAILDRGLGCLIGLAVGDALGTTLEFKDRDSRPPVTDIVGGGPFRLKPGEWTDDTSMALCLADSLLACGRLDQTDILDRFLRWYDTGENSATGRFFDIGNTTRSALERYRRTGAPESGSTDPGSAGNGSIMRLAPIVLRWHHDPSAAVEYARAQSRTTHATLEAVEGCALLAEILVDAIVTGDKSAAFRPRTALAPKLDAIGKGAWRGKKRAMIESTPYVVHTLEAALWAVDGTGNFADAVILAANLADDADTVAAVTGQIAGAIWGLSGIPERWLDILAWRSHIEDRGRRLLAAATSA